MDTLVLSFQFSNIVYLAVVTDININGLVYLGVSTLNTVTMFFSMATLVRSVSMISNLLRFPKCLSFSSINNTMLCLIAMLSVRSGDCNSV